MIEMYNQSKVAEERISLERPGHLKSVLDGKRFELMRMSLEAVGYPDASIAKRPQTACRWLVG